MGMGEIAVILILGLPLAAVIGVVFLVALKIVKNGGNQELQALTEDEARKVQEIHQSLERMEKRIESLETLLMDSAQTEEKGNEA